MFHAILRAAGKSIRRSKATPVALSTRIRLARNLNDFPFPGRAETSQRREILSKCMGALGDLRGMLDSVSSEMDDLSDLDKQILVEQHLISPELSQADDGAGLVLSKDRSCCVMINEEDAMSCYEYDWYYKILPTLNQWHLDPERIKDGKKVESDFIYSSGTNQKWMTIEQLREFLKSPQYHELQKMNI